jgi:hypothetical protein
MIESMRKETYLFARSKKLPELFFRLLDGSFTLSDLPKFNGTYANISIGQRKLFRSLGLALRF